MVGNPHDDQALVAESAAGPMAQTTGPSDPPTAVTDVLLNTVIGRYRLLQVLGEGGFGTVYQAEQREPVRRQVALKLIKLGMDTRAVIARFEAERQALAVMDHPNIARVFDAGATDTGRPYFVMELVRGVPITHYCDTHNLSTGERLELFIKVCNAVQHAHTKGIIHRDLKPSNVLVSIHDGKPVPKVIDFGIAKATIGRLTDMTLVTEHRQLIGTPEYMSPEQAEMTGLDIDTRTDVYSLGVLMYELLTGTTPFESSRLRSAGYSAIQRIIREEEPPRPSARLSVLMSSLAEQRTRTDSGTNSRIEEIAKRRRTDPGHLRRQLRGDLDWIALKALEKDRTHRYETASDLAADLQRHLNHEPVLARPAGTAYRVRKFIRRHKLGAGAAAVVAASLLLGLGAVTYGLLQARAGWREAVELSKQLERRTHEALAAQRRAEEARADMAAKRLDVEVAAIDRSLQLRPEDADLHAQRGDLLMRRGKVEEGVDAYQRAIDLGSTDHWTWYRLGHGRLYLGDIDGYRACWQDMNRRFGASEDGDILERLGKLALLEPSPPDVEGATEFVDRAVASGNQQLAFWFMMSKSLAEYRAGRYQDALPLLAEPQRRLTVEGQLCAQILEVLCRWQIGEHDAAIALLEVVEKRMTDYLPTAGQAETGHENWLAAQILHREATSLIGGDPISSGS